MGAVVMQALTCKFCGKPIEEPSSAYREVAGWERPGRGVSGVSGSSLVLRKTTGPMAHADCVTRRLAGINVDQGALL